MKIDEITDPSALFGEMSWLLGRPRTATIRTKKATRTLCIPAGEIESFLAQYPQTTQVVFGLKELCDHLPDAVILSDAQNRVTAFNAGAAQLYGRDWGQMQARPAEEVYQDAEEYRAFQAQVRSASRAREQVLKVSHPTRGLRLVYTSMTAILDQQRQVQGFISLGRDITRLERLRRLNRWLVPQLWPTAVPAGCEGKVFHSQLANY